MSSNNQTDWQEQQPLPDSRRMNWVKVAFLGFVGFAAIGTLLVWSQSMNPLFGVPMNDPASIICIVVMGFLGMFGAVANRKPQLASDTSPATLDEVKRLAKAGETIRAIKLYRELTGAGLAQAKEAVEGYAANHRTSG